MAKQRSWVGGQGSLSVRGRVTNIVGRILTLCYNFHWNLLSACRYCEVNGNHIIDLNNILRKLIDNVGNTSTRPGISRSIISTIITSAGKKAQPRFSTCYRLSLSSTISKDKAIITEISRGQTLHVAFTRHLTLQLGVGNRFGQVRCCANVKKACK